MVEVVIGKLVFLSLGSIYHHLYVRYSAFIGLVPEDQ